MLGVAQTVSVVVVAQTAMDLHVAEVNGVAVSLLVAVALALMIPQLVAVILQVVAAAASWVAVASPLVVAVALGVVDAASEVPRELLTARPPADVEFHLY